MQLRKSGGITMNRAITPEDIHASDTATFVWVVGEV